MNSLKVMLNSKKFRAAILGAIVAGIAHWYEVPTSDIWALIAPILTYIGAQGIADHGVEK